MAVRIDGPKFYAWDSNGNPLSGGKLYTWQSGGTSIPKDTYTAEDAAVANTNPVILNGSGFADVYLDGVYNLVLYDQDDNLIWSKDHVSSTSTDEWVYCQQAMYSTNVSIAVAGNQTEIFKQNRRVKVTSDGDVAYSQVGSASYSSGMTTVQLNDAVVNAAVVQICVSLITEYSLPITTYKSIDSVIAANLANGAFVQTQSLEGGWTDNSSLANDAGQYQIVTASEYTALTGNTAPDEINDFTLNNGRIAVRVNVQPRTVSHLKRLNLSVGAVVRTNSYREPVPPFANKGGGTYEILTAAQYGGTPDGYGDHLLSNGNVARLITNDVYNVQQFGAYADNTNNDTDYCRATAAALEANDGGKLEIPTGVYLVGKQNFAGVSGLGYAYLGLDIFRIEGCTNPVIIEGNNSKFNYVDGLRYGSFDPVTGLPYTPASLPFTNTSYAASTGNTFFLLNNVNVKLSNIDVFGNSGQVELGGQWGDTGRQLIGSGFSIFNNQTAIMDNCHANYMCLDGGYIRVEVSTEDLPIKPHTMINCSFEYNARQGFSWTGGNHLTAIDCKFNKTGKGLFSSAPASGMDIEPTGTNINRNGVFINCEFRDNNGVAMVADSGDSRFVTFDNCFFQGTTNWALWPQKPDFLFRKCTINGRFVNSYTGTDGKATVYEDCLFTDEAKYGDVEGVSILNAQLSSSSMLTGVTFSRCTFNATRMAAGRFDGAILTDCFMNCSVGTENLQSGRYYIYFNNSTVTNITVNENITANLPTTPYYIYSAGATTFGKNNLNSLSGNNAIRWAGTLGGIGVLGQFNQKVAPDQYQSIISGRGFTDTATVFGTQQFFSYTAPPPNSGTLYQNGDICWNKAATVDANSMRLIGWYAVGWVGGAGTWVPMYVSTVSPAS